jgi:spermidine synthase
MGFTLRAALAELPQAARVTVAELVPEIIAWARGPMRELADGCLDDPRVELVMADVADVIAAGPASYDAILLDVDNGPDGLVRQANDRLYSARGLRAAKHALRPGGVLAIWSAEHDDIFAKRLRDTGFDVDEVIVREVIDERDLDANGEKGGRHIIWFAQKP